MHASEVANNRVEGVDALRGILACGVMMYHFLSWTGNPFFIIYHDFLEILAVSFVEMFFIISGFSLFYVYHNRLNSFNEIKQFFVRRFFRIAPLFYVLLALAVSLKVIAELFGIEINRPVTLHLLFTNITFLFGLLRPSDSLLVAGWSIGVEMAMYLFFPLLLLYSKSLYATILLCLASLMIVFCYSLVFLNTNMSFTEQWSRFTFFINHLHFFVSGFLLFHIFDKYRHIMINKMVFLVSIILLMVMLLAIFLYSESSISYVLLGGYRYGLFLVCFFIVLTFAFYENYSRFLLHLGDLSYSIYLGHFFVFIFISKFFEDNTVIVSLGLIGTYVLARCTYKYIEKPMIRLGKNFG